MKKINNKKKKRQKNKVELTGLVRKTLNVFHLSSICRIYSELAKKNLNILKREHKRIMNTFFYYDNYSKTVTKHESSGT